MNGGIPHHGAACGGLTAAKFVKRGFIERYTELLLSNLPDGSCLF